ncbi:MAG: DUF1648 domain-containing protein [Propioniciclava sp.]|uniref:DUF1648 domain-containing protein n=1 Tax=Propioniciclava sp. TaxID=2038686 RepID=UPI0039E3C5E2
MTPLAAAGPARPRRLLPWFVALAVVWCAAMAFLPWATIQVFRDSLPSQVAVHWGADGLPDQFEPVEGTWVFSAVLTSTQTVCFLAFGAAIRQLRATASTVAGMATFLGVLNSTTLYGQTTALTQSEIIGISVASACVTSVVVGALFGLAMYKLAVEPRATRAPGSVPPASARLAAADGGRIAWIGRPRSGPGSRVIAWLGFVPMAVMSLIEVAYRQWLMAGILAAIGVALVLVVDATLRATVVIDASGVRVRGLGLITMTTIPMSTIESAEVTQVRSGDFGGLGLRSRIDTDGSAGLVTASGEAVQINRAGTGPFFITMSPAAEVAATLNTLIARDDATHSDPTRHSG